MTEKIQTFLITASIIEGRHYIWPDINSAVIIQVDKERKCTNIQHKTDCPFYNEYFVFEFNSTLDKFLSKTVTITVIKPGTIIRRRKVLGFISFDVATVWQQEDHQFYQKWAVLSAPIDDLIRGTRGYLKISITVLSKGQVPKIPKNVCSEEIEGNLLISQVNTTERQRVHFVFNICKAADLVKKNPLLETASRKFLDNPPTSFLEIKFSGINVKTTKKSSSSPSWNEELVISDLFPPLCQRFKIQLRLGDRSREVFRFLNLKDISSDTDDGFMPTFGPAFLHFYSPNPLEGYLGKVLLFLETQLAKDLANQDLILLNTENFHCDNFNYEDVVIFTTIFEASCISKKYCKKPICFKIYCGPMQKDGNTTEITSPNRPKITNKNLCFLEMDKFACTYQKLNLPDCRRMMFNYNFLKLIAGELAKKLDSIEVEMERTHCKATHPRMDAMFVEALDYISSSSQKYIDIAGSYSTIQDTVYNKEQLKKCITAMNRIYRKVGILYHHLTNRKGVFNSLDKIRMKIDNLFCNIEDWPQIYIWMIYDNKRVAYSIIDPKTVIYSAIQEEKGPNCGIQQTVLMLSAPSHYPFVSYVCKLEIALWMGLERFFEPYLATIPACFQPIQDSIPRHLSTTKENHFEGRAHIFQGRFSPGADSSGLCDPYIHVVIGGQYRETQVLAKTINPIWDQTLIFREILLLGCKPFISQCPPKVVFEVYDKDACCQKELVGRCLIKPKMSFLEEEYKSPRMEWYSVKNRFNVSSEVLAVVELIEKSDNSHIEEATNAVVPIPVGIRANLVNYRIDVVFWGVRNLKKIHLRRINKPKIVLEVCGASLTSDTLASAKENLNFSNPIKNFEVEFPAEMEYAPPLRVIMYDCRSFGMQVFSGIHLLKMDPFFCNGISYIDRIRKLEEGQFNLNECLTESVDSIIASIKSKDLLIEKREEKLGFWKIFIRYIFGKRDKAKEKKAGEDPLKEPLLPLEVNVEVLENESENDEDFDWWTKFYASLGDSTTTPCRNKLTIYGSELESQSEFNGFTDMLQSIPLYRGKRTGDEHLDAENTTGVFKGTLRIYRWPVAEDRVTMSGLPLSKGAFQDLPSNHPVRFVLRVYCVRALNLRPKDRNGKSDPYLVLTLNEHKINDKANRIMRQVSPIFGRCFEFSGVLPQDHTITIAVYDWDMSTKDDLIGETSIDLENRLYSKHRGQCGIAESFHTSGYCEWRDHQRPESILQQLCTKWGLPEPEYRATSVGVAFSEFSPEGFEESFDLDYDRQVLALYALRRWAEVPVVGCPLVPEHVETRSLYDSNKPGVEQGKIQLWIDIFPVGESPTPQQVNITARKAEVYELRVVIWNVENITMDETDLLTRERKSDIYVKGWVDNPASAQYTDVHYRSLSGEGNFNWRFIFQFEYLSAENKLLQRTKKMFSVDDHEVKMPCRLTLHVLDSDCFSGDDFLGLLTLELSRMPRGAPSANKASLLLKKDCQKSVNLFKTRRTKGWWPFKNYDPQTQEEQYAGCAEVEMELLLTTDAEKSPAGFGRDDPQGLPKPNRPDSSFSWFTSPWRAFKYLIKLNRGKCCCCFFTFILIGLLALCIFAFPNYTVKRLMGA